MNKNQSMHAIGMPVYGKNPPRKKKPGRILESNIRVMKLRGKRFYFKDFKWPNENTKLAEVEKNLMFGLRRDIAKRIKSGQKPNVLEWGCGTGRAIGWLGRRYNGRINAYGYSDMVYKGWQNKKYVKFIHATKEDLLRYFKNNSIDVIYSHLGLRYLDTELPSYIRTLLPKLRVGGILLSEIPQLHLLFPASIELQGMEFKSTLKNSGNRVLMIRREK